MSKRKADSSMGSLRKSKRLKTKAVPQKPETPTPCPLSSSADSLAPPFLRNLPRELRDRIFHYVWTEKPAFEVFFPSLPGTPNRSQAVLSLPYESGDKGRPFGFRQI